MQPAHPHARSFQPRRRKLSPTRDAAYRATRERWVLATTGELLDLQGLFDGLPVVLDIGFGGGEGVVQMAAARPHEAILGCEVHTPGVALVLEAVTANDWRHVRVVEDDVLDFLPRLPAASLAGIRLWFPDPWPKKKQQHRRLFRPDVVNRLVNLLVPGATFHVATDIDDYARQVLEVAAAEPRLQGGVVPRPDWRPLTRYEQRGLAAGRTPVDLMFTRVGESQQ
ncbi:MAG TPA: tRNA (guanosine(46)-N7)-methyltransferase TrmB [Ilumatobacteraceae bacterium]|nr:tRNA (guanosine(46)-N7)-methyltransferase TrmB [Ilumatobacteraceae bacterium]